MDVSTLEGGKLDEAVARALGWTEWAEFGTCGGLPVWRTTNADPDTVESPTHSRFRPSVDWETGGRIIERERISVLAQLTAYSGIAVNKVDRTWQAEMEGGERFDGSTPLIAAMRAFVASKQDV
jgi:hypothetical protein